MDKGGLLVSKEFLKKVISIANKNLRRGWGKIKKLGGFFS